MENKSYRRSPFSSLQHHSSNGKGSSFGQLWEENSSKVSTEHNAGPLFHSLRHKHLSNRYQNTKYKCLDLSGSIRALAFSSSSLSPLIFPINKAPRQAKDEEEKGKNEEGEKRAKVEATGIKESLL